MRDVNSEMDAMDRLEKTALKLRGKYWRLAEIFFDVMEKHIQECECGLCEKASRAINNAFDMKYRCKAREKADRQAGKDRA